MADITVRMSVTDPGTPGGGGGSPGGGGGGSTMTLTQWQNQLLAQRLSDFTARSTKTVAQFLSQPGVSQISSDLITVNPSAPVTYEGYNFMPGKWRLVTTGSQTIQFRDCSHAEKVTVGANSNVVISRCAFDPNGVLANAGAGLINKDLGGTGTLKLHRSFLTRYPGDGIKRANEIVGNLFDLPLPSPDSHVDVMDLTGAALCTVEGNVIIVATEYGIEHQNTIAYVNTGQGWLRSGAGLFRGNLCILSDVNPNSAVRYSGAAEPPAASAIVVGDRVTFNQGGNASQDARNVGVQGVRLATFQGAPSVRPTVLLEAGAAVNGAAYGSDTFPATDISGQAEVTVDEILDKTAFATNNSTATVDGFNMNRPLFDGPGLRNAAQDIPFSGTTNATTNQTIQIAFVASENPSVIMQPWQDVATGAQIVGGLWSGFYKNATMSKDRSGKWLRPIARVKNSSAAPSAPGDEFDVGIVLGAEEQSNMDYGFIRANNKRIYEGLPTVSWTEFDDVNVGNAPDDFRYRCRGLGSTAFEDGSPRPTRSAHNGQTLSPTTDGYVHSMAWLAKCAHEIGYKVYMIFDTKGGSRENDPVLDSISSGGQSSVRTFAGSRYLYEEARNNGMRIGHFVMHHWQGTTPPNFKKWTAGALYGQDENGNRVPAIPITGTSPVVPPVTIGNIKAEYSYAQIIPELIDPIRPAEYSYAQPWTNPVGIGVGTLRAGDDHDVISVAPEKIDWCGVYHLCENIGNGNNHFAPMHPEIPGNRCYGMGRKWMMVLMNAAKQKGIIPYAYPTRTLNATFDGWRLNVDGTIDAWTNAGPATTIARKINPGAPRVYTRENYAAGSAEVLCFSVGSSGIYTTQIVDVDGNPAEKGIYRLTPNPGMTFGSGGGEVWPVMFDGRSGVEGTEIGNWRSDSGHYEYMPIYGENMGDTFGGELIVPAGPHPANGQNFFGNPAFEDNAGPIWG